MDSCSSSQLQGRTIALVVMSGVVVALHVGKVAPALPALINELDLSLVIAGWLVAGISTTAALIGLPMGRLVDRFGSRQLLLIGLVLSAAGSMLGAMSGAWPTLLFSRAVEGLGMLWVVVSAPTLLVQGLSAQQRARVLGWWGCFMPAGTGLSIFFAPLLLPLVGWRGLWWLIALVALLMVYLVRQYVPRPDSVNSRSRPSPAVGGVSRVLQTPALYLVGLCFGLYSFQYSATLQFVPLWLGEERGVGLFVASMIAVLYCVANVLGNLLGGRLMQRGRSPQDLLLQCSLGMALVSMPIFRPEFPDSLRLVALLVFPVVGGLIPPACFALVPRLAPEPHLIASSNGLVVQLLNAGMFLGAPIQALVVSHYGWSAAAWVLLPAALLAACLAWVLGRLIAGDRGPAREGEQR